MRDIVVEVLYSDGCPHADEARAAVREVLETLDLDDVEVREVRVETLEEAERLGFPGSPTVRVNGKDVYPSRTPGGSLACRRYAGAFGWQGWPPRDFIQESLEALID